MSAPQGNDLTLLLETAVIDKSPEAVNRLVPAVYDELRALAEVYMRRERRGHTLSPTALVHEAYLKLIDQSRVQWQSRAHFLAIAAQSIRRILLDHARARGRGKRGGGMERVSLSAAEPGTPQQDLDLLALDEALERLAEHAPVDAQVVEMRFFGGLTIDEIAEVLEMNERTVRRRWNFAKAWLFEEIKKGDTTDE